MRILMAALSLFLTSCSSEYLIYKTAGPGLVSYAEFNEEARDESGTVVFNDGTQRDGHSFRGVGDSLIWEDESPGPAPQGGRRWGGSLLAGVESVHFSNTVLGIVEGFGLGLIAGIFSAQMLSYVFESSLPGSDVNYAAAIGAGILVACSTTGGIRGHRYVYQFNW